MTEDVNEIARVEKEQQDEKKAEADPRELTQNLVTENQRLTKLLKSYVFLADQVKYNATMYEAIEIVLKKLTAIEKKLDEVKK